MESMLVDDVSLAIDMAELGFRPIDWTDGNKDLDDKLNNYFGKEQTIDFTVYSAEIQLTTNGKKLTTDDDEDLSISNEAFDIDPETGEKIFHPPTFAASSSSSSSPSSDKWIEEYLSEIESASNQILPATTTNNTTDLNLDDIPLSFFENSIDQTNSDWLSTFIDLEETNDSTMFSDPIISNQILQNFEDKSNITTISSSSSSSTPIYISLPNENNSQLTLLNSSSSSSSIDDEYSTSSSSNSRHRLYSSLQNDRETTLIETKLEQIEHDDDSMTQMMANRLNARSIYQGQQDEEALSQLNIPLTLDEITQSSTEEYNRQLVRLSHLNHEQMNLIKDIRRRGKNKIAAQNCRKRKAVSVESLLVEVDELKRVKHELEERKRTYQQQIEETRHQYEYLHRQVLPNHQLPPAITVQ